eukprot:Blabericola_migrator_1__10701@NODE_610_length_7290_cov_63_426554_g443_i0_p4_GENE_NODE_610_length_7290_cov_63_426554_g443_i0NODE_610_length_7290_cov_63_426554_g443_i0_p4_ORF_typecomplete_len303_score39_59Peptidase_C97/PF05903_14/8_3e38_NODE_610_length_7290_cov_63_426554_g443_i08141722
MAGLRTVIPIQQETFFTCHEVVLRVYDISHGLAQSWSPWLIGQKIDGVWHTGVEVFGREYFYGGGVFKIKPGGIAISLGLKPIKSVFMGATSLTKAHFERFVLSVSAYFTPHDYHLVKWNCNHFSDMLCRFLVNRGIPRDILDLPSQVKSRFSGRLVLGCIQMMSKRPPVTHQDPILHTPPPTVTRRSREETERCCVSTLQSSLRDIPRREIPTLDTERDGAALLAALSPPPVRSDPVLHVSGQTQTATCRMEALSTNDSASTTSTSYPSSMTSDTDDLHASQRLSVSALESGVEVSSCQEG